MVKIASPAVAEFGSRYLVSFNRNKADELTLIISAAASQTAPLRAMSFFGHLFDRRLLRIPFLCHSRFFCVGRPR
jgi:hypothetical protein